MLDLGDAPSARTLGASPNQGGPALGRALLDLFQTSGRMRSLKLPRLTDGAALIAAAPPGVHVNVTGQPAQRSPAPQVMSTDAADIRSVYR
ncbi:hypothetical protein GCM10008955_30790 [Deinococcus malanensis]|uniref:Uncharacterized protein n=1 Tax=Deinococcus malanensis TaxID=1706855 RepID=A0ABQ2F2Z2_9DEIO|nr:hypothetical protein GCM10008955_30790 [Deinococcus malanensis]